MPRQDGTQEVHFKEDSKVTFPEIKDVKLEIRVENHPEHTQLTLKGNLDAEWESLLDHVATTVVSSRQTT